MSKTREKGKKKKCDPSSIFTREKEEGKRGEAKKKNMYLGGERGKKNDFSGGKKKGLEKEDSKKKKTSTAEKRKKERKPGKKGEKSLPSPFRGKRVGKRSPVLVPVEKEEKK